MGSAGSIPSGTLAGLKTSALSSSGVFAANFVISILPRETRFRFSGQAMEIPDVVAVLGQLREHFEFDRMHGDGGPDEEETNPRPGGVSL